MCDVYLVPVDRHTSHTVFYWTDEELSAEDRVFYQAVIVPEVTRYVQEYLERPGPRTRVMV
jgi:hypothetical protein